ncbi:hypothetical protein CPB84DRAFT_762708 [Gymnopilus junonius]|uniref:Uncharacterized protein n=1 Tax=Gymnopilus junonius TaxID=109634 RepID=A0A9P5P2A7_GYMJU|nr:hypothetical protein CPB84DRAFT_762708 [Gymnopilus junonius]
MLNLTSPMRVQLIYTVTRAQNFVRCFATPLPNSMVVFPLDIFFNICDELASRGDVASLRALSLACKSLVPLCQRNLFKKIAFDNEGPKKQTALTNLSAAVKYSPHILTYVCSCQYTAHVTDLKLEPFLLGLATILIQLDRLSDLCLVGGGSGIFDWILFSNDSRPAVQKFRDAIDCVLKMPQMIRLEVSFITNFPATSFVCRAKALDLEECGPSFATVTIIDCSTAMVASSAQELRIPEVLSYHADFGITPRSAHRRARAAVTIDGRAYFQLADSLVHLVDFKELRSFTVSVGQVESALHLQSILCSASSLEEFGIYAYSLQGLEVLKKTISLGCFRKITTLKIAFFALESSDNDALPLLCDGLERLSGLNALQHLYLKICDVDATLSHCNCGLKHEGHCHLNRLGNSVTPSTFPDLRKFEFLLLIEQRDSTMDPAVAGIIRQQHSFLFPLLRTMDGLQFNSSIEYLESYS